MGKIIERFAGLVKGSITGFDRIVFKGLIRPLMSAKEVMKFCPFKGILNKNYKNWMIEQSQDLSQAAEKYAKDQCGQGVIPLSTWRLRKEELAHERQKKEQIESGLIGVWSCLESASSYRAHFCEKSGYPQLRNYQTRCKHLYFYFDHQDYGFMNIRLQTWFPDHVQICLNGRETSKTISEWKPPSITQGNFGCIGTSKANQPMSPKNVFPYEKKSWTQLCGPRFLRKSMTV